MEISEPYLVNGVYRNLQILHQTLPPIEEEFFHNKFDGKLPSLTEEEKLKILAVLERDKNLHQINHRKVARLKSELSWLRRKGAIKVGQDDPALRTCGRCQSELGLLINRGAICSSCRQRVCKECRKYGNYGRDWVCVVCSKQIEIQLATGEWLNEFIRRPSRRRDKSFVTPAEGLRNTLVRRSWSISSPTTTTCDVREEKEEEVVKRKPPQKPPRKSLATDENVPPWGDDQTPDKPPRRYSMSSFDGMSSRRPSSRVQSAPGSRTKSPESQDRFLTSNGGQRNSGYFSKEWNPNRTSSILLQEENPRQKHYYYGNERLQTSRENERPSTLPRRPLKSQRPYSCIDLTGVDDPNRFHSIPRTAKGSRSPSEPRGRSAPAPLRENLNRPGGFVSSGPVTSTLLVPSGSSVPCTRSNSLSRNTPTHYVSQDDIKITRRNFEPLKNFGRANSSNSGFWALTGRGAPGEVKLRDDEGGGIIPQFRRLQMRENVTSPSSDPQPFDSGLSESSVGPTSDISDEGAPSPAGQHCSRILLPRSNTSITSGFASTGRPIKDTSQNFVRRCKSFQAGSPRRSFEDELSMSPSRKGSGGGGQVAKFIQEFEKGIQQTFVNMKPKKLTDSFRETSSSLSSRIGPVVSRSPSREDRSSGRHSDLSISDGGGVFDSHKIIPEGDDYKLVFISSDSSKESEFNSSIDSDHSPRRFNAEEDPRDNKGPRDKITKYSSLSKPFTSGKSLSGSKGCLVDASVNTEGDYLSEYPVTEGEDFSSFDSTAGQYSYPQEIRNTKIVPSREKYFSQEQPIKKPEGKSHYSSSTDRPHLLSPLDALHPNEIELMLQQTEVVQAEAQALQKALMGAFDTEEIKSPSSSSCWLAQRGLLHDFSATKYPEGVSPIYPEGGSNRGHETLPADRFLQQSSNTSCRREFPVRRGELSSSGGDGSCGENIYENVDYFPQQVERKPTKECKSVCIQTDIEPVSCEEDNSETAEYSDASEESSSDNLNRYRDYRCGEPAPPLVYNSSTSLSLCKPQGKKSSTGFGGAMIGQYECTKGKGQEASATIPPSSSYLPNPPQPSPPPTLQTPPVHLQHLASDCDYSSVSRSSECESVSGKFDVISGRSAVALKPTLTENVRSASSRLSSVDKSSSKLNNQTQSEVNTVKNSSLFAARARAFNNGPSSTPPESYPRLTSGGRDNPLLITGGGRDNPSQRLAASLETKNNSKMSQVENKLLPESDSFRSDVNAAEELITKAGSPSPVPLDEGPHSSGTSEGEDTDEEVHVSGSYNVSTIGNDSDDDASACSEKVKLDSSLSDSETDEEKQIIRNYDVTKASSDSDAEIKEGAKLKSIKERKLDFEDEEINENESRINESGDSINEANSLTENEPIFINESREIITESESDLNCVMDTNNDDLLSNDSLENDSLENEPFENEQIENETTDLPECDQAMGDLELSMNSNDNLIENVITDEKANEIELSESIIENKSETESNLGDVAESNKEGEEEEEEDCKEELKKEEEIEIENKMEEEFKNEENDSEDKVVEMEHKNEDLNSNVNNSDVTSDPAVNTTAESDKSEEPNASTDNTDKHLQIQCDTIDVSLENTTQLSADLVQDEQDKTIINFDKDFNAGDKVTNETDSTFENEDIYNEEKCDKEMSQLLNEENKCDKLPVNEVSQEIVQSDDRENNLPDAIVGRSLKADVGLESCEEVAISEDSLQTPLSDIANENLVANDQEKKEDASINSAAEESSNEDCSSSSALQEDSKISEECNATEITGNVEVERGSSSCSDSAVTLGVLAGVHEPTLAAVNVAPIDSASDNWKDAKNSEAVNSGEGEKIPEKELRYSSESGHSSDGGESDVGGGEAKEKEANNIVKINIVEKDHVDPIKKGDVISECGGMPVIVGSKASIGGDSIVSQKRFKHTPDFLKSFAPTVPLRKAKRSSSSDGLSSSSDIDRSDADASDSADTVIDNNRLHSRIVNAFRKKKIIADLNSDSVIDDSNRDSDGPSSADSVLQGADSESQCSDGSEEGNLVTIVAVGEDTIPRHSSQGKIYIRSDSTDSDVQIKPTCIVVTGSSGLESGDDGENEEQRIRNKKNKTRNDITILEVTSEHRKDHVMSVRVTSPESSRSTSPARKSNVSELQSMILTHRERQQQIRRSPVETSETSSLTNYFTVTLGTDSPLTHRRTNKTPEVRRSKVPDRGGENNDSTPSTPTLAMTPTPTLTPSPTNHTPSPTVTPTPDHSEGDLLAYEEHHVGIMEDPFAKDPPFENNEVFDDFYADYDEQYETYVDASAVNDGTYEEGDGIFDGGEGDGTFDSIEDADSIGESNYSETSSEEGGYEREEELRGYCKRGYDFTLHTIIEESCEESDYEKKPKEDENPNHDKSELEKYFFFGLGNGTDDAKKYANEESEYSDTFSETSSSNFSEGMESLDGTCEKDMDPEELASSRLEKYFSGFLGFERQPSIRSVGEESEIHSDESDSVGSDSEGSPSPEQPRKKLFRSRGVRSVSSNRSHGYSSDKCEGIFSDGSMHSAEGEEEKTLVSGDDEGSTESEETAFDKGDGQFDTIKRRKKKKILSDSDKKSDNERADSKQIFSEVKQDEAFMKKNEASPLVHDRESPSRKNTVDEAGSPKEKGETMEGDLSCRKYQSRDSGFIGSSDDLLKDKPEDANNKVASENKDKHSNSGSDESENKKKCNENETKKEESKEEKKSKTNLDNDNNNNKSENEERSSNEGKVSRSSTGSSMDLPPYSHSKGGSHNLSRKDSFNNWSSDEETNIMMNKMRIFFKNMFSSVGREVQKGQKIKSPQLVMFEARLTNLMRSVPGINDEQVKEIVEYLSSEETWSDSYDSSDYTSSDLEGPYARLDQTTDPELKSELQEQISASCQQIIKKFDQSRGLNEADTAHFFFGNRAYSESSEDASLVSKDTAFLYQKIMSSISNMKPDSDRGSIGSGSQSTSPPLLMKVIHHIGDRIVALMHEVSGGSDIGDDVDSFNGGNPVTSSPRQKLFLPKKYGSADAISFDSSIDKSSLTSTSFESEDSPTDTEQSPESETGTPKIFRRQKLSIISEKSSAEDFTSFDSQRTVFNSNEPPQHYIKNDPLKSPSSHGQSYYTPEGRGRWHSVSVDADKFDSRDHIGLPKTTRSGRRTDPRKAKSHLSLEKIHHEDVKASTGERSESLGDLLDRVRSSSEFSSSYEQLDSDSTLKASDSLDRQIGSSSSNVRLNASSRGSLTTSSRGSLAASSRGSLNASSRGSLQGSSGPEEEEERKGKKLSFFRNARRSSVPDASQDTPSPEVRSTTLPRSTQPQILTTGTLPRSQSSQEPKSHSSSGLLNPHSTHSPADRPSGYHTTGGPRSARYHPPGYRPPPAGMIPKRAFSTPSLRKISDESGACVDDVMSASSSAITSASSGGLSRAPPPPSRLNRMGGGGFSSNTSSRAASPFGGSLGKTSGNESVGGSLASFDNSPDEEEARRRDSNDAAKSPLIALGPKSRSESLASVCSTSGEGRFGTVPVQGEILVSFQYNYKEGHIECHVQQCRDLAPVDTKRNRSDPYVKAYLLPDKSKSGKRKTKVKRHSLSPAFDEIFKFGTTLGELESRSLWLSVWHSDMFGRNVFLGEVLIPLSDAIFEDSSPRWHTLLDRTESLEDMQYGAVLVIALKFVSPDVLACGGVGGSRKAKKSRGALQVRIKEASGLVGSRVQSLPDPICKGVLLPEKGKSFKQKTNVVRKTSNPRWNHTMTFDDVSLQDLYERSLELSIWDHDRFGSSDFMGGCRLNLGRGHQNDKIVEWLDASGLEQKLWEQMLERPNLWVESSMLLRPNMDRPIYSSAFTD